MRKKHSAGEGERITPPSATTNSQHFSGLAWGRRWGLTLISILCFHYLHGLAILMSESRPCSGLEVTMGPPATQEWTESHGTCPRFHLERWQRVIPYGTRSKGKQEMKNTVAALFYSVSSTHSTYHHTKWGVSIGPTKKLWLSSPEAICQFRYK